MNKKLTQSKNLSEKTVYAGKWLNFVDIVYQDEAHSERTWESVQRKNQVSASVVIPQLLPSQRFILVKQYRPAIRNYSLEFPAGLIDEGETPAQTALRELKEETGYTGTCTKTSPPTYTTTGISSEICYFVTMEIDESLKENQHPQPNREPHEFMEVFLVEANQFPSLVKVENAKGTGVDAKLYNFFYAHF